MALSRNAFLIRSIAFGAATKVAGALIVFLGLPIIANSLPVDSYTVFLYGLSLSAILTLTFGAALTVSTRDMAKAFSSGSLTKIVAAENNTAGNYLLVTLIVAVFGLALLLFVIPQDKTLVMTIVAVISVAFGISSIGEANRVASRTDHISSVWQLVGNLLMFGLIISMRDRGLIVIVLIYFGTPAVFGLLILAHVWFSNQRLPTPQLDYSSACSRLREMGSVLVFTLSDYAKVFLSGIIVSLLSNNLEFAKYTTLVFIITRLINPVSLITRPLMPAYLDAIHHNDAKWINGVRKLVLLALAIGLVVFSVVLLFMAPEHVEWILPPEARNVTRIELGALTAFAFGHGFITLMSPFFFAEKPATVFFSTVNLIFVLLSIAIGAVATSSFGAQGMLCALSAGTLIVFVFLVIYLFRNLLRSRVAA